MKHWSPFQAWHLSSGFVVKLFSKHWQWNLTLKVHCKEILKPSIKNKLEVMCYLFSWTSVCTTQTIVDEELRHCHSQGKASGLGVCHLSLDHNLGHGHISNPRKTNAKLSIWTTRNWQKHDMYTKFQASTHSCTPLEIICTRTVGNVCSGFSRLVHYSGRLRKTCGATKAAKFTAHFLRLLELLPFFTGAQFLNYRKWM